MKDTFRQKDVVDWILNDIESGSMIPVYGHVNTLDSDVIIKSCLLPKELIDDELNDFENFKHDDLTPAFTKYGDGDIKYLRFNNDEGIEPLIVEFQYDGLREEHIELTEEFRSLFSLYYDAGKKEYTCPSDNDRIVCKLDHVDHVDNGDFVKIDKKYLKSYLTAKAKVLLLYFHAQIFEAVSTDGKYECERIEDIEEKNTIIAVDVGNSDGSNYSLLRAKKIIFGCPLKQCNLWPFNEKHGEYIDFIIGMDENGNEIKHSCDPSTLSNFSGANPNAPHYLTPVFFDRAVLEKYIRQSERYTIEPGILMCGSLWSIYIDNEHPDYVSAYLGDLGRDLPTVEEQHHWRGCNKIIDGHLSKAKIDRDFNVKFSKSESVDFVFKNKFQYVNEASKEHLGWPFFKDLSDDDAYNFTTLRIPLREEHEEFDELVLRLVKVLIDSLNEEEIKKQITSKETIQGGISKLEKWFEERKLSNYANQINFLRNLQNLRSTGTGHRKGKQYKKISNIFGITGSNFKDVFSKILQDATSFLQFIYDNVVLKGVGGVNPAATQANSAMQTTPVAESTETANTANVAKSTETAETTTAVAVNITGNGAEQ